jgi:ATP-binding cassette subfamily B protein
MAIQQALVRIMRDRTVIAVAHRLSTLASFDRILVMRGGRIVEDGSPTELRARGGFFDGMWRLQARGVTVDG